MEMTFYRHKKEYVSYVNIELVGWRTYLLKIDLGIRAHTGLADEVDDPLLTLIVGQVEALGKVAAAILN